MKNISERMVDNILTRACQILAEASADDLKKIFGASAKDIGEPPSKSRIRRLCEKLYGHGELKRIIVAVSRTQSRKTHVVLNLHKLGGHLIEIERFQWAEQIYKKAFEVSEIAYGSQHLQTGMILADWSGTLYIQGKHDQAVQMNEDAVRIFDSIGSNEGHLHLARSLTNLAKIFQKNEEYDQAMASYEEALKIREIYEGVAAFETVRLIHTIGIFLTDVGAIEESLPYFERAFLANYYLNGLKNKQTIGSLKMIIAVLNTVSDQTGDEGIYERYIHYLKTFKAVS